MAPDFDRGPSAAGELVVRELPQHFLLTSIWRLPFVPMSRDWFGKKSPVGIEYALGATSDAWYFAFRCRQPAWCEPAAAGSFVEGLWDRDVAELFVVEPDGTRYQEFNFAPSGAWWSSAFTGYRERDLAFNVPRAAEVTVKSDASGWQVAAKLPGELFHGGLPAYGSRLNVSAIVGKEERLFFSVAEIPGSPDFHKTSLFPAAQRGV